MVAGEVEHRSASLLRDAYDRKLKPIYRFLDDLPAAKHIRSNYGTIDCSLHCPFNCSFCTIINVQGRKSRYKSPSV